MNDIIQIKNSSIVTVTLCGQCNKCFKIINHEHLRPNYSVRNTYANLGQKENIFSCNYCDWKHEHKCEK